MQAMPVMQEAIHAGRGVGMFRVVGWLVTDAIRSPRLRVSAWITLAGLGYFFAVMVGWIIYADSRGI